MVKNLTTLYNQLRPALNKLNEAVDEIEQIDEKSGKSKILEGLLHDIEYHNFLKYKLKTSSYACCLMIGTKHFPEKIMYVWEFVHSNRKNIMARFGRLFDQRELDYINTKINKRATIEKMANEDKLRLTKVLHTIKHFIPSKYTENFFDLTDEQLAQISFSQTISIAEGIKKIGMVTDEQLYDMSGIKKNEWKVFVKNNVELENSVLYDYFLLPEKHANNFQTYFDIASSELIEKIENTKKKETKNEYIFQYNVLKTYNDIRQTFDIIIHLNPLQLFALRLFYGLDIRSFFGANIKYVTPLYVFHFSHSFKQAEKMIFLCEKNYFLRYMLYTIATIFFLLIGNLISLIGLMIWAYAKRIAEYIKTKILDKINLKIDLQLPIKLGGALLAFSSLLLSPYLHNLERIFTANPFADMISSATSIGEPDEENNITVTSTNPKANQQDINITLTGFDVTVMNDVQKDLQDLKDYMVSIQNTKNIVQNDIDKSHGAAEEKLGIHKLERYETFYDLVNKYAPEELEGIERVRFIKTKIRDYVDKNRTYIRQKVSDNAYNPWGLADLEMVKYLPSGVEIDLDQLMN